jgi:acyl-CoA thioesterase
VSPRTGQHLTPAEAQAAAERVVAHMLERDGFSRWLGISVSDIGPARATCTITVRPEMLNGFGVCHGGVTFALADSAFAFASNTQGNVAMSIDNQISYPAPAREGDVLTATAREESDTGRLAFYRVEVHNQAGTLIAIFKGTVYKTKTPHLGGTP